MRKHYTLTIQPQNDTLPEYNICGFWESAAHAVAYVAPKVSPGMVAHWHQTNRCH